MIVMTLALAALMVALAAPPSHAFDRSNIPLKNWGGFSLYREAVYDDLERLVTAGLAERAVINTKPINRMAAARIVARAIDSIRRDSAGAYNGRRDLEAVLDRLMDEFRPELAALGVSLPGQTAKVPGFVSFIPVDRAQARAGVASHDFSVPNSQGLRFQDGLNGGLTFDSRLQVGDFLTFYVQPEMLINDEFGAARLLTGYAKLTLFNVELLVGRENLWWGPGIHGSLILSNNARPLDQVRVGGAEPFLLPLVGEWVGPTNMFFFVAQLEERRDHPRAKLAGMRATATPFSFLELGISRVVMFNGEGGPQLDAGENLRVIFYPPAGDERNAEAKFRTNNLFSVDADLRLANVDRWGLPAKDVRVYGEFGWDDTCCESSFIPLKAALSFLVGVHWIGVFGDEGLEVRSEYARTSTLTYSHDQFRSGYSTRGEVIGHHIGTDGEDYYTRLSKRFDRDLMIGVEINRAVAGATTSRESIKTRTLAGALDASYRFADVYSIFGQYRIAHVENRNFRAHDDGWDHVLRVELTRSFR
jgi:capsule assembly protein Wzi